MIVRKVRGDIFDTPLKHIAFAVNTDGYNDSGVAGEVSNRFWPELAKIGPQKMGQVLTHSAGDKTLYAIVCHSLDRGGWATTPAILRAALDSLAVPDGEEIAIVMMGSGFVGQMMGANVPAILQAMTNSTKSLVLYSL